MLIWLEEQLFLWANNHQFCDPSFVFPTFARPMTKNNCDFFFDSCSESQPINTLFSRAATFWFRVFALKNIFKIHLQESKQQQVQLTFRKEQSKGTKRKSRCQKSGWERGCRTGKNKQRNLTIKVETTSLALQQQQNLWHFCCCSVVNFLCVTLISFALE